MAALKDANTITQDDLAESPMTPSADPSLWGVTGLYTYFVEESYAVNAAYSEADLTEFMDKLLGIEATVGLLLGWRENKLIRDDSVPGIVTWTLRNAADDDDLRTQEWDTATDTRDAAVAP